VGGWGGRGGGGGGGGYIWRKSRAIVLQQCGLCEWEGVTKGYLILGHTKTSKITSSIGQATV